MNVFVRISTVHSVRTTRKRRNLNQKVSRELISKRSTSLLGKWISSNIYGKVVSIVVTSPEESWSSLHQSAFISSVREPFLPIASTPLTSFLSMRSITQIGIPYREKSCYRRMADGPMYSSFTRCSRKHITQKACNNFICIFVT